VSAAPEPTIADVLALLNVLALEVRAGFAEMRADVAEVRIELAAVRQDIHDLEQSMRDLWTEHWGHSHPEAS
jgi:hypothetical protein